MHKHITRLMLEDSVHANELYALYIDLHLIHSLCAVQSDGRRDPELISGLRAVDHAEEFNRINVAFVHAERSFCISSRFCLSLALALWKRPFIELI